MSERRAFILNTSLVAAITALSRVLGLVRDMTIGALLGASRVSDIFWIAFELPNLARRALGEGALSAFLVPLFTAERREHGERAAWRYAANALNAVAILGAILTLLGIVFSEQLFLAFGGFGMSLRDGAAGGMSNAQAIALGTHLTRIMFPYLLLLAVASVLMGLCHANRRFAAPAFGSILLNLSMILAGLLAWRVYRGESPDELQLAIAHYLALSVLAGIVLRVLVHLPTLWRAGFRYRLILEPRHPRLIELFQKLPLACVGLLMTQLMISVNKFFAMFMDDGYVTQLSYASRIVQLPLGILASAMATTILPQLTQHVHDEQPERQHALFGFAMRATIILFLPATMGLIMLREPLVALLFERLNWTAEDTGGAAWAILFYSLGLVPMASMQLVVPLYYARLNLREPLKASVAAILLNIVLNALFMHTPLRQGGLALATSLSVLANLLLLLLWLEGGFGELRKWRLGATAIRCLAACAVMGLVIFCLRLAVESLCGPLQERLWQAAFIALSVPLGAGTYFVAAMLLKTPDLWEAMKIAGRKWK